jgi:hypothetical protein
VIDIFGGISRRWGGIEEGGEEWSCWIKKWEIGVVYKRG